MYSTPSREVFFSNLCFLRCIYSDDDVLAGMGGLGLARTTYICIYVCTDVCLYIRMMQDDAYVYVTCMSLDIGSEGARGRERTKASEGEGGG